MGDGRAGLQSARSGAMAMGMFEAGCVLGPRAKEECEGTFGAASDLRYMGLRPSLLFLSTRDGGGGGAAGAAPSSTPQASCSFRGDSHRRP